MKTKKAKAKTPAPCRGRCLGTTDATQCLARSAGGWGWYCTLPRGHKGKHVACSTFDPGTEGHNCHSWEGEE